MKPLHLAIAGVTLTVLHGVSLAEPITSFETRFNTDFTAAGVGGLRGNGTGSIDLSGISGSVSQAYLYWHGPTNSSDPGFNADMVFNGNEISGTNIGFSDDNFWDQDNSQAYRADVTDLVSGDGTYSLAGLAPDHSNGATLAVFFDDGDATNNRDVVTFDGNDANFANDFDPLGWDVTLSGINYTSGTASILMGVSDGQDFFVDDDGIFNLNGTPINSEDLFEGATVPQTADSSVANGGLWDLLELDVTSFLSPGLNTLSLTHEGSFDALSAIHFAINLPAGSAPDQPDATVPEPGSLSLLLAAITGLVLFRRRESGRT